MKLKIKHVNESIDKQVLVEADLDLGYRLKALETLMRDIEKAVVSAGYKFKAVKDKGFYILPSQKTLCHLDITAEAKPDEQDTIKIGFKLKGTDYRGNVFADTLSWGFEEVQTRAAEAVSEMMKTVVTPAMFAGTNESLNEETISEYGPLSAIKNVFAKAAATYDEKRTAKNNEDKIKGDIAAQLGDLETSFKTAFDEAIKAVANSDTSALSVVTKVNGNTLAVELQTSFLVSVLIKANSQNRRMNVVDTVKTTLGAADISDNSMEGFLKALGKALNIKFTLTNVDAEVTKDDAEKSEVDIPAEADDSETKDTKAGSWEELIGAEAWAELTGVGEAFQQPITETYKMKIPASKYQAAFEKCKGNDDASIALVKYFLKQETGDVFADDPSKILDYKTVDDIRDMIKGAGSFNPNAVFPLLYTLTYIKKYKGVNPVAIALAQDLPAECNKSSILEQPQSVVYSKILFNTSNNVDTLKALLKAWYTSTAIRTRLAQLSPKSRKNLVDKFELPAELATTEKIDKDKALELRKLVFIDSKVKKFRDIKLIKQIEAAINSAAAAKSGTSIPAEEEEELDPKAKDSFIDTVASDIDNINDEDLKQLLKIAGEKGRKDATIKADLAKAVLTALGKLK